MNFPCPSAIRQHYGKLSETALRAEIEKALDHPTAEATQLWSIWTQWLSAFGVHMLRPPEAVFTDEIKLSRWVAFALRYLHPLLVGRERPQSAESVIEVINNSAFVVSTLLFGSEQDCLSTLRSAFDRKLYEHEMTVNTDQQVLLRGVQFRSSEEKTARNWSDALLEPFKVKVVEYFHSIDDQALRELSLTLRHPTLRNAARPSAGYRMQFEQYVRLALDNQNRQLYVQVVGYLNEFDKRSELANSYAAEANRGIILFVIIVSSVGISPIEPITKALLISLIAFNGFALFYGRLFNFLRETFAVAQAALQTLAVIHDSANSE